MLAFTAEYKWQQNLSITELIIESTPTNFPFLPFAPKTRTLPSPSQEQFPHYWRFTGSVSSRQLKAKAAHHSYHWEDGTGTWRTIISKLKLLPSNYQSGSWTSLHKPIPPLKHDHCSICFTSCTILVWITENLLYIYLLLHLICL